MNRVMIVGCPGAGKTTLALALGQALDLPVFHLDRMFLRAGWVALPRAERDAALAQVFARPGYVLEGGYPYSFAARLADCDTLVWLDIPAIRRFFRLRRRLRCDGHVPRPDLADGCLEAAPGHRRSLWRNFWLNMPRMRSDHTRLVLAATPGTRVVHLRSTGMVRDFLISVQSGGIAK